MAVELELVSLRLGDHQCGKSIELLLLVKSRFKDRTIINLRGLVARSAG